MCLDAGTEVGVVPVFITFDLFIDSSLGTTPPFNATVNWGIGPDEFIPFVSYTPDGMGGYTLHLTHLYTAAGMYSLTGDVADSIAYTDCIMGTADLSSPPPPTTASISRDTTWNVAAFVSITRSTTWNVFFQVCPYVPTSGSTYYPCPPEGTAPVPTNPPAWTLTCAPVPLPACSSDYKADFESPLYIGSATGSILYGQDGWYEPIPGPNFLVYQYTGNTALIAVNSSGNDQFIAAVANLGIGRATHDINMAVGPTNIWTIGFDFVARFSGILPSNGTVGSFQLLPSLVESTTSSREFSVNIQWVTPATATTAELAFTYYDSAGVQQPLVLPGGAFSTIGSNDWYRLEVTTNLATNAITQLRLLDLTAGTETINVPVGWYLFGGSSSFSAIPPPSSMRFTSGNGVVDGEIAAYDNIRVTCKSLVPTEPNIQRTALGTLNTFGDNATMSSISVGRRSKLIVMLAYTTTGGTDLLTSLMYGASSMTVRANTASPTGNSRAVLADITVTTATTANITLTLSSAADISIMAVRVYNLNVNVFDEAAAATGTSTSPDSGFTAATGISSEYLQGFVVTERPTSDADGTWQNSFIDGQHAGNLTNLRLCEGYAIVSVTGTYKAAKINVPPLFPSSPPDWISQIATYG